MGMGLHFVGMWTWVVSVGEVNEEDEIEWP